MRMLFMVSLDFAEAQTGVIISVRLIARSDILVLKKETVMKTLAEDDAVCQAIIDEMWKVQMTTQPSRAYFIPFNGKDATGEFMNKITARYGQAFLPATKFQYDMEHHTKITMAFSQLPNGIVAASFSSWSGWEMASGGVYFF